MKTDLNVKAIGALYGLYAYTPRAKRFLAVDVAMCDDACKVISILADAIGARLRVAIDGKRVHVTRGKIVYA